MSRYTSSIAVAHFTLASLLLSSHSAAAGYGYGGGISDMSDMGMKDGKITIMSPEPDQMLQSGSGIKLQYKVQLSSSGDHLHVYVDNGNPIIVRKVSGCPCGIVLPDLSSGTHIVRVKEATSSHALTGNERDISFTVK